MPAKTVIESYQNAPPNWTNSTFATPHQRVNLVVRGIVLVHLARNGCGDEP